MLELSFILFIHRTRFYFQFKTVSCVMFHFTFTNIGMVCLVKRSKTKTAVTVLQKWDVNMVWM